MAEISISKNALILLIYNFGEKQFEVRDEDGKIQNIVSPKQWKIFETDLWHWQWLRGMTIKYDPKQIKIEFLDDKKKTVNLRKWIYKLVEQKPKLEKEKRHG